MAFARFPNITEADISTVLETPEEEIDAAITRGEYPDLLKEYHEVYPDIFKENS